MIPLHDTNIGEQVGRLPWHLRLRLNFGWRWVLTDVQVGVWSTTDDEGEADEVFIETSTEVWSLLPPWAKDPV